MTAKQKRPIFNLFRTYMGIVRGSVGSKMFRECHFTIRSRNIEVLEDGRLACAFFVSVILKVFGLIRGIHTTVNATEKDMITSGWTRIKKPKVGCVIVYALKYFSPGNAHRHMGFYIGNGNVVDNSSTKGMPQIHRWNYRAVESLWWHKRLTV